VEILTLQRGRLACPLLFWQLFRASFAQRTLLFQGAVFDFYEREPVVLLQIRLFLIWAFLLAFVGYAGG
jgi:hypothetical protein